MANRLVLYTDSRYILFVIMYPVDFAVILDGCIIIYIFSDRYIWFFYDVEDEIDFMEEYILVLHISIHGSVFSVSFMEKSLSCIM